MILTFCRWKVRQTARAVHDVCCPDGPWVAVNIAGFDDNHFSDALFGHVRGAFTGAERERSGMIEQAAGGTLFLDEIGDLSPNSQIKLLRLLQEREYLPLGSEKYRKTDARIVVATNVQLKLQLEQGTFRKDLYYRLCSHQIEIPPLRERTEDIPLLLDYYLDQLSRETGRTRPNYPKELTLLLSNYHFPGNIRELRAMIYNAVSTHKSKMLPMETFEKHMGLFSLQPANKTVETSVELLSFHDTLPSFTQAAELLLMEALRRTGGNQSMAAKLLGVTQPALNMRLKKLNR